MACRRFLFLQGVATPFFKVLSKALQAKGHSTYKINFCGGDSLFSQGMQAWRYKLPQSQLPQWVEQKHQQHRFTDIILFGDTRPVHRSIVEAFKKAHPYVNIHVFEEGYLRPHWVTLEQGGVNGFSPLITQDVSFWQQKNDTRLDKEPASSGKHTFTIRALYDISYRLANAALKPLYPHYETHRPFNALSEYWGWAQRFPAIRFHYGPRNNQRIKRLIKKGTPYYLFPLQVDADAQIIEHSPFSGVLESIDCVLHSFAKYAPTNSKLVIKNHPLDTGLLEYNKHVQALVKTLGLKKRVVFLESGHLPTLLQHTQGTVLVNSTTGTSALFHGSPVVALGTAIFDMPGLTFQHGLDRFWSEAPCQKPDPELFAAFRANLIAHSQINGDFYSRAGMERAVAGSLLRMQVQTVTTPQVDQGKLAGHSTTPTKNASPLPLSQELTELTEPPYLYKQS